MTVNSELLTEKERARMERNDSIAREVGSMLSDNPGIKPWRVYRVVGVRYGITPEQVRVIMSARHDNE